MITRNNVASNVPTILIVEDDPTFNYLMRRYVEKSGCRAVTTCYSTEVLTLAKEEKPAAIVLDIAMPEMNSWETLRNLKGDPATRDIPVVLCSELGELWDEAEGASGHLQKPVMYQDFLAALADAGIVKV